VAGRTVKGLFHGGILLLGSEIAYVRLEAHGLCVWEHKLMPEEPQLLGQGGQERDED
jgi:hypothetical protein